MIEPWLNQSVLPAKELIPVVRRGTIDVLCHWLAAEGLPFDRTDLERKAISGIDPAFSGETPEYSMPGKARVVFKAFGETFQPFERARIHHPATRFGASLWLFCLLVAEGSDYRAGSLYVGLSCGDGPERRQRFLDQIKEGQLRIRPAGELRTPPTVFDHVYESKPLYGWCWERERWTGTPEALIAELSAAMRASWAALGEEATVQIEPATTGATGSGGAQAIARALGAKGYRYSAEQIATLYTALKTKGFVILSGLSGTGKSRLAMELAGLLGATADRICLVPVRPDWRDGTSLLGYFNPVTGAYVGTDFLHFTLRALENYLGHERVDDASAPDRAIPSSDRGVGSTPREDFLRRKLREQPDAWLHDFRSMQSQFLNRQSDAWTDEDLQKIWLERNNGLMNLGQAPPLNVGSDLLRVVTDTVADIRLDPGERFVSVVRRLKDASRINHYVRVQRALALFDTRVPGAAQTDMVNKLLADAGADLSFDPSRAVANGTGTEIDKVWGLLNAHADRQLRSIGIDDSDAALRTVVLWFLAEWLNSDTTGTMEARPHARPDGSPRPFFMILDEMNLARVEYYFSDFLSVLESPRHSGLTEGYVQLHSADNDLTGDSGRIPPRLHLPPNLYIIGTVNVDETTFAFSPKVLDRAFTLEFRSVDLDDYPVRPDPAGAETVRSDTEPLETDFTRNGRFAVVDKERVYDRAQQEPWVMGVIRSLNERLSEHEMQFGYRVVDEMLAFLDNLDESAVADGLPRAEGQDAALDAVLTMKVLPKFNGPYHQIRPVLDEMLTWAGASADASDGTTHHFPRLVSKLREMQHRGEALGHVSFS